MPCLTYERDGNTREAVSEAEGKNRARCARCIVVKATSPQTIAILLTSTFEKALGSISAYSHRRKSLSLTSSFSNKQ